MVMASSLYAPIMEESIPYREIDNFLAEMASLDDDPLWDIDGYSAGSWHTDTDEDLSDKKFEIYEDSINEQSVNLDLTNEISSETSDMSDTFSMYTADLNSPLLKTKKKKSSRVRQQKNEIPILPKRERNKLAARRCRKKQKDRIEVLEKEVESIEHDNHEVLKEILTLQSQLEELQQLLISHNCVAKEK